MKLKQIPTTYSDLVSGEDSQPAPLCRDAANPDLWFPRNNEAIAIAKQVCAQCPLTSRCLQFAQQSRETGVWGGQLLEHGKIRIRPLRDLAAEL